MRFLVRLLVAGLLSVATAALSQSSNQSGVNQPMATDSIPKQVRILPEAPSSTRDNGGYLLPGVDPENQLVLPFLKHIVYDQKQFWTSPTRLDKKGATT